MHERPALVPGQRRARAGHPPRSAELVPLLRAHTKSISPFARVRLENVPQVQRESHSGELARHHVVGLELDVVPVRLVQRFAAGQGRRPAGCRRLRGEDGGGGAEKLGLRVVC